MKLKCTTIAALLCVVSLSLSPTYAQTAKTAEMKTKSTPSAEQKKTDAEILGWLIAVNKNEIAVAEIAKMKATNPDVKNFANFMIKEHTDNLQQTLKLSRELNIKPEKTISVLALEKEGSKEKSELKPLNDKDFQKKYMDAMVTGHEKVLTGIDHALTTTNDTSLKSHLEKTRGHVDHHLSEAKRIQGNLAST